MYQPSRNKLEHYNAALTFSIKSSVTYFLDGTWYVAFKGNGNSSNKIVRNLNGDKLFLTNSYGGLKNDIV